MAGKDASKLFTAIAEGAAPTVKALLARGVDLEARNEHGSTPLMSACARGETSIAKLLLGAGADLNAVSAKGASALSLTVAKNRLACAKLLLEHGPAAAIRQRALQVAKKNENTKFVALLKPPAARDERAARRTPR